MRKIVIFLFAVMVINIFGEEKFKIEDFYTMKEGFVFYFEGSTDTEKISIIRKIENNNEKKTIYIESCNEDLTGELTIEERIYKEKIVVEKDKLTVNESDILRMPIQIGKKWKGRYNSNYENAEFEIVKIENSIVIVEVMLKNKEKNSPIKTVIMLKKDVGIISEWNVYKDYRCGLELKNTYLKPVKKDEWYLMPYRIENIIENNK